MLIGIDQNDSRPLYQQIAGAIKEEVCAGRVAPGEELPSIRELADVLGVNLHTVRHAYRVLAEQGVVRLGVARRARVLPAPREPATPQRLEESLLPRLREIAMDAVRLGVSDQDLRELVDHAIRTVRKGSRP